MAVTGGDRVAAGISDLPARLVHEGNDSGGEVVICGDNL